MSLETARNAREPDEAWAGLGSEVLEWGVLPNAGRIRRQRKRGAAGNQNVGARQVQEWALVWWWCEAGLLPLLHPRPPLCFDWITHSHEVSLLRGDFSLAKGAVCWWRGGTIVGARVDRPSTARAPPATPESTVIADHHYWKLEAESRREIFERSTSSLSRCLVPGSVFSVFILDTENTVFFCLLPFMAPLLGRGVPTPEWPKVYLLREKTE